MTDTERGYLVMKKTSDEARAYSRRVQLRARLIAKAPPHIRQLRGAARKAAMDKLEKHYLRPRIWRWKFDHQLGTQDRESFRLYKAALKLRAQRLRQLRQHDTARMLDRHVSSLVDIAPREAWCYYPAEWQEISRALRPFGSSPPSGKAMALYSIYQRIRAQHTTEEIT